MSLQSLVDRFLPSIPERVKQRALNKAAELAARNARLTPDGLDPEDPEDSFILSARAAAKEHRDSLRIKEIRDLAKQILAANVASGLTHTDIEQAVTNATRIVDLVNDKKVLPR